MAITKDVFGFSAAQLSTDNMVEMEADVDEDGDFDVRFTDQESWCFDEAACREAAEFFTMLADEIARRKAE